MSRPDFDQWFLEGHDEDDEVEEEQDDDYEEEENEVCDSLWSPNEREEK